MAGRGRKKLKSSPSSIKTLRQHGTKPPQELDTTVPEIPSDLVELIISRLSSRDNIRASLVCKQWREIAISLCKKPMWLMFIPKSCDFYDLYDPYEHKSYWLKFPELRDSKICYAEHGWLLLYRHCDQLLFFFNPYTRKSIDLPVLKLNQENQIFAFSAPPTSSDCLVFSLTELYPRTSVLAISTCCVKEGKAADNRWSTAHYQSGRGGWYLQFHSKVVVSKGRFYCLDSDGGVGVYDPEAPNWTLFVTRFVRGNEFIPYDYYRYESFVAEHKGDVYLVSTSGGHDPVVYKLEMLRDIPGWAWWRNVEVNQLRGTTFFVGCLQSHAVDDAVVMRTAVCFPKFRFLRGRRCVTYSLEKARYYPLNQSYDWVKELDPNQSIWIQPPKDLSVFNKF